MQRGCDRGRPRRSGRRDRRRRRTTRTPSLSCWIHRASCVALRRGPRHRVADLRAAATSRPRARRRRSRTRTRPPVWRQFAGAEHRAELGRGEHGLEHAVAVLPEPQHAVARRRRPRRAKRVGQPVHPVVELRPRQRVRRRTRRRCAAGSCAGARAARPPTSAHAAHRPRPFDNHSAHDGSPPRRAHRRPQRLHDGRRAARSTTSSGAGRRRRRCSACMAAARPRTCTRSWARRWPIATTWSLRTCPATATPTRSSDAMDRHGAGRDDPAVAATRSVWSASRSSARRWAA